MYKFRDELLDSSFDMSERVEQNRLAALQECFDQAQSHSQGDMQASVQALEKILQEEFGYQNLGEHLHQELGDDIANDIDESSLLEQTNALLAKSYEKKMAAAGESRNEIERIIYLQTLDTLWREHLYSMDTLKTGISLRGYNQKDPLVEYKKESYSLFMEFIEQVKTQAIKTLHIIQIKEPALFRFYSTFFVITCCYAESLLRHFLW